MNSWNKGSKNPKAKLTEAQVLEIRSLVDKGHSRRSLRHRYGVSTSAISGACSGKYWKHI